ncbi:nol1/nop2/sun family putative RNA methylase [Heliomicrobium modesticaldum Ice1]|uniref:Nol1/nop2/sun family putative RNA methylase n=1 Tax=Heliobacterium modesticaldum (strain ATCC 51547 / Ice1) TaxID=498761 RepID=B0TIC1_HELMI|nr:RsmF rRNA methyltransferase first C-terminal domain-containing protein [Heliomicrobium modesticaldum]ABZ83541.1 nol1/nop2/sun family putative RNA methylase [Heliomicrobium modesticaldum Ice1]
MLPLPPPFINRMTALLLESERNAFFESYESGPVQGLRLNPLKLSRAEFLAIMPFRLDPVAWCPTGFYVDGEERPGKHPFHAAGLYYIQEPSAMAVVEALDPQPGERVLDLCAAPGGKATQIAGRLAGRGLLVANEIHPKRVKALSENLERWGARNILVTQESPERLAGRFIADFDRIVVDAPCSGEGMFRKLPEAMDDWSEEKVFRCAAMQRELLPLAARMLRPGGVLVYSTCTFAPEENERQIEAFLRDHREFERESFPAMEHFATGYLEKTARLWPHRLRGEGHFIARLRKRGGSVGERVEVKAEGSTDEWAVKGAADHRRRHAPSRMQGNRSGGRHSEGYHNEARRGERQRGRGAHIGKKAVPDAARALFERFCAESLQFVPEGPLALFGDALYVQAEGLPSLDGIKVARAGWHLGTVKAGRFEPSHALALALRQDEWRRSVEVDPDGNDVLRYLRGESWSAGGEAGWTVVTVGGFPLGWAKISGGQCKNHYPKGLRWLG